MHNLRREHSRAMQNIFAPLTCHQQRGSLPIPLLDMEKSWSRLFSNGKAGTSLAAHHQAGISSNKPQRYHTLKIALYHRLFLGRSFELGASRDARREMRNALLRK